MTHFQDLLYEKKLYHEVLEEVEKLRTLVPDAVSGFNVKLYYC